MFSLAEQAIEPALLREQFKDVRAGALATFEGRVRNHNEGYEVTALEYEAYSALAVKEAARILQEAKDKFDIYEARCVHRVGTLLLGEVAVWVGVNAAHRDAAFRACRYIIDEIKERLPIWKKEQYAYMESTWVNCIHDHKREYSRSELYSRQMMLPQVGLAGQVSLKAGRVLLVGAGGLGSSALLYLAGAGVGTIGICDGDLVDVSNLHRQILYGVDDIGSQKAKVACQKIHAQYPFVNPVCYPLTLIAENADEFVNQYDVIVDCSDNFATKFLLSDVCARLRKTLIQSSVYQFEGQLSASFADGSGQCLRCLWRDTPEAGCVGTCTDSGVLGATVGAFGSLQASEAIKALCGITSELGENMVLFDLLGLSMRKIKAKRDKNCSACGLDRPAVDFAPPAMTIDEWQRDILEMSSGDLASYELVDIREPNEDPSQLLRSLLRLEIAQRPLSDFDLENAKLSEQKQYLFICQRGARSDMLVKSLRSRGLDNVFSLKGGVEAVRRKYIA